VADRPLVIAFDVIETLFPLEPLRQRMIAAGQPGHLLELWFTRLLRDAFALAAAGGYHPFAELATHALASASGHTLPGETVQAIIAGLTELDPHPDVEPAMRRVHDAGVRVITLTNGSAHTTTALLRRAGVEQHVDRVLSVDDVRRYKPASQVYQHAASTCQVPPRRVALVAAHAWDTHGARAAGLVTGWVSRLESRYPNVFTAPDVTGNDLVEVVDGLLGLPAPRS
jgi:2-haloacid dehalogenase